MKNKLKFLTALSLFFISEAHAQIGVGTTTPEPSAALDVTSTTQGLLPPRVTYDQLISIVAPAEGLMVYCTNCSPKGLYVFNGSVWSLSSGGVSPGSPSANGSAAVAAYSCATASAGTMTSGTPVSGVTQTITATVTRTGTYTISAIANGITFAATGTFAGTGAQNIVLTATGTPTTAGSTAFTLNTSPNCSFSRTAVAPIVCTVKITASVNKNFLCHNLGADTSLDPHIPVMGLQGAYIQWGQRGPNTTGDSSLDWQTAANASNFAAAPTAGWVTPLIANGSWGATKTTNDPCPSGYRVPTSDEWTTIATFNTISRTGIFTSGATAYGAALHYGPNASTKSLTLPAAGYRQANGGSLSSRGSDGYYWSSTEGSSGNTSFPMYFNSTSTNFVSNNVRSFGFSLRCIAE
jgi:uncharacterized protein (TIGR02145 family)